MWERTRAGPPDCSWPGLARRAARTTGAAPVAATIGTCSTTSPRRCCPRITPEQRDLLVRAAPLERLSGSLCDAALQVTGSAEVLAALDRADLFLVALDAEHEWYRCHHLFRDVLLREPEARSAADTRDVLRRAAAWFEQHDRIDEAVRHLLRADDAGRRGRPAGVRGAVVLRARRRRRLPDARRAAAAVRRSGRSWRSRWPTPRPPAGTSTGCRTGSTSVTNGSPRTPSCRDWRQPARRRADDARAHRHSGRRVRPCGRALSSRRSSWKPTARR